MAWEAPIFKDYIMATKNDVTGDEIKSKGLTEQGKTNFDAIDWSVKLQEPCKQCGELECKFECINSKY